MLALVVRDSFVRSPPPPAAPDSNGAATDGTAFAPVWVGVAAGAGERVGASDSCRVGSLAGRRDGSSARSSDPLLGKSLSVAAAGVVAVEPTRMSGADDEPELSLPAATALDCTAGSARASSVSILVARCTRIYKVSERARERLEAVYWYSEYKYCLYPWHYNPPALAFASPSSRSLTTHRQTLFASYSMSGLPPPPPPPPGFPVAGAVPFLAPVPPPWTQHKGQSRFRLYAGARHQTDPSATRPRAQPRTERRTGSTRSPTYRPMSDPQPCLPLPLLPDSP